MSDLPEGVSWSPMWRCHDCGHDEPIAPGQDTGPVNQAHECDSQAIAIQQTKLAAWEDGYRFALTNYADELVQADVREFGTGWAGWVRRGAVTIEAGQGPK